VVRPLDLTQILQGFQRLFSKWYLCNGSRYEDVLSIELEYRLKRAITCDPIVGSRSNLYRVSKGCFSCGSNGMVLVDEVVLSIKLEYRLKRAITCDPTVESRSNFYRGFQRLFSKW